MGQYVCAPVPELLYIHCRRQVKAAQVGFNCVYTHHSSALKAIPCILTEPGARGHPSPSDSLTSSLSDFLPLYLAHSHTRLQHAQIGAVCTTGALALPSSATAEGLRLHQSPSTG